jgi:serine/tyrosine/threonine adenylyltransferase
MSLQQLLFNNRFLQKLPTDPNTQNECRYVHKSFHTKTQPTPVSNPKLIAYSQDAGELLDIQPCDTLHPSFARIFSGNQQLTGMDPYASCYGGHQFGNWAGQLGDGRAIALGEVKNKNDEHWEIQLKGAGPTPYSRMGDGRAVLRSSIREFLCSEAMHYLQIPTTRALCLVTTGDSVIRDMFYDGNPQPEIGAICTRVSPSFIRFGTFEIFSSREEHQELQLLMDYCIEELYPHLGPPSKESYLAFFEEVCIRTAKLIAQWMSVGFVHGVMNTDNMSILGYTIDYGPYGWLEPYDPQWTPNTTDFYGRRYAYGRQPEIALWNLVRLANSIFPIIKDSNALERILQSYHTHFVTNYNNIRAQKLGLMEFKTTDTELFDELYIALKQQETDHTLFYRNLKNISSQGKIDLDVLLDEALYDNLTSDNKNIWTNWFEKYQQRLHEDALPHKEKSQRMDSINPKYVLRNWVAQLAIDQSTKENHRLLRDILQMLKKPFTEQSEYDQYAIRRPEWARNKPGCSTLSCSS